MDLISHMFDYDFRVSITLNDLCCQVYFLLEPLYQSFIFNNVVGTLKFYSASDHPFGSLRIHEYTTCIDAIFGYRSIKEKCPRGQI